LILELLRKIASLKAPEDAGLEFLASGAIEHRVLEAPTRHCPCPPMPNAARFRAHEGDAALDNERVVAKQIICEAQEIVLAPVLEFEVRSWGKWSFHAV